MAVFYKKYKLKNKNAKTKDYTYARAVSSGTVHTTDLAEVIQRNCTCKKSDVLAVLAELVEVMQTELQNSHRVHLDGFGAFKIGIKSKGEKEEKDFNPSKNIIGMKVLFQPEMRISPNGVRTKALLMGAKVKEAQSLIDVREKKGKTTPSQPGSGGDPAHP